MPWAEIVCSRQTQERALQETTSPAKPPAPGGFREATRELKSLTGSLERTVLYWLAARLPPWVNSDHLTVLGFLAMVAAGGAALLHDRLPLLGRLGGGRAVGERHGPHRALPVGIAGAVATVAERAGGRVHLAAPSDAGGVNGRPRGGRHESGEEREHAVGGDCMLSPNTGARVAGNHVPGEAAGAGRLP